MGRFFLAVTILLLAGCATTTQKAYNVPFVDVVETIELSVNLSRDDVLSITGEPLYVEFGDSKTGQIFWIYEVRAKEVKSDITFNGESILNKRNKIHKPSAPIHKLKLEFRDDKLYRWSPMNELKSDTPPLVKPESNTIKKKGSSIFKNKYLLIGGGIFLFINALVK